MSDRSIADYGLLSDCHSAALVSGEGSIDWLCFPRFDSPSTFGRLLDPDAGHWSINPVAEFDVRRRYLAGSLVIETQFATATGMVMLTDALIFNYKERDHDIGADAPHVLVRVAEVTEGTVELEADYAPRPEYGLVRPRLELVDGVVVSHGGADVLCLAGPPPTEMAADRARWRIVLNKGERVAFALQHGRRWLPLPESLAPKEIVKRLDDTVVGWQSWSKLHQRYEGPAEELVHLSGRVLRALTYQPTGAIIAAPTTSLPEKVGGTRNWDYRYCWLRDASFTLDALWVAACPEEAGRFVQWIIETAGSSLGQESGLQIMYGVGGEHDLTERELPHLAGWRGSRPVRVGNAAWNQTQIDIYGEVLDAVVRLKDQIGTLPETGCEFLADIADAAAAAWGRPDAGIWEARAEPRHNLYSKLMCWVALDRAVVLAEWIGRPDKAGYWEASREEVRTAILDHGWSEQLGSFTQSFGDDVLDASALMMAITGFLPVEEPRMAATIERIAVDLAAPCGLLYRYTGDDGLDGGEGLFIICTFWLVQCLAAAGQAERAVELFERTTAYTNDLGLLSEEADPATGELLGNFPQAFSHVGLVNAAWALSKMGPADAPPDRSRR
ncbi:MAG: glycoside hydrolase family 15 protein [Actinomycetota bacterium]|nr:glycoside hydrolase family 15 protein [Actinomycetota bacterium]